MSDSIDNPETLLAHDRFVRALARSLLGDTHGAEDVAQDTWLALTARPRPGAAPLRAWLAGIVRRLAARANRTDHRRLTREQAAAKPEELLAVDQVLEREAMRKSVVDAVLALEEPYRSTILLRFFEELPPRVVAARTGVPTETARTRIKRGLEQLRSRLGGAHGRREQEWRAVLLPLAWPRGAEPLPGPSLVTSLCSGVLLMSTNTKTLVSLGLVAAFGIGVWAVVSQDEAPAVRPPPDDLAGAISRPAGPGDRPEPAARTREPAPAAADGPRSPTDILPLTGRVLAEGGAPVPGAGVEVRRRPAAGLTVLDLDYQRMHEEVSRCVTDGDGRFHVALARARAFELHVQAAGFAPEVVSGCHAGQDLVIRLQRGALLEGRVSAAGSQEPIPGAKLLGLRSDGLEILHGVTGADGTFCFKGLSACAFRLEVVPPAGVAPQRARLALAPGQMLRHDVEIDPGGTVRGTVTNALTGARIAGAEIGEGWVFRRVVRTDARGEYAIRGFPSPGVSVLHVRAAGYGGQEKHVGRPAPGERVVDFELVPGASARGRILDPAGMPMAGVYAAAVASEHSGRAQKTDWRSTRTRPDGTFLLESLRTDVRHALFIRHDGFGTVALDFPSQATPATVLDLGDVTLQPGGVIEGRIADREGTGVFPASVELVGPDPRSPALAPEPSAKVAASARAGARAGAPYVDLYRASTDPDGRFRFADLAAGEYALTVRAASGPEVAQPAIIVRAGQLADDVELVLDLGLSVRGRVITPSGEPPGATLVTLELEGAPGGSQESVSGPTGAFEFRGVRPGAYALTARPIAFEGEAKWADGRVGGVAAGSAGVDVVLKRIAWVEGVVLDASGTPAAGAIVLARRQEGGRVVGHFDQTTTGSDGRFKVRTGEGDVVELVAGPAQARSGATGAQASAMDLATAPRVADVRAGTRDVVIRLPMRRGTWQPNVGSTRTMRVAPG